jgi:hypothetical protein
MNILFPLIFIKINFHKAFIQFDLSTIAKFGASVLLKFKSLPNLALVQNVFAIITSERTWLLQAKTSDIFKDWMDAIQVCLLFVLFELI